MNKKIESDKEENKQGLWIRTALLRDCYYMHLSDLFKSVPSRPTGFRLRRQPASI